MPRYHLTTDKTWDETIKDLAETFRKWGIVRWLVEPTRPARARNQYHDQQQRSVLVRYTKDGQETVLTMAKQDRAHDNLRVLYLAIEALRLNEARGIAEVVASAYAQLPPPGQTPHALPANDPYAVIGVDRHDSLEGIERVWKARLWEAHPDHGGSQEKTAGLNAAMDAIRREKNR